MKTSGKHGIQILVVDDEPSVRDSIRMLLVHDGHKVQTVDSGEAALALLAQQKFDLVMTDFWMPGMKGDELVVRIKQLHPGQAVIMATAFAEDYQQKVIDEPSAAVDALLPKPFSLAELREAVERVFTRDHPDK